MEGKIKLLNPDLTGDCSSLILKEIEYLSQLKDRLSNLFYEKEKLQHEYDERSKKLSSLIGSVFDYIKEEEKIDYTVNKSNIIFKNVNGGSKS